MARQGKEVDLSESIKGLAEVSNPLQLREYVIHCPPISRYVQPYTMHIFTVRQRRKVRAGMIFQVQATQNRG